MLRAWDYKLYGSKAPPRTVFIAAILNINLTIGRTRLGRMIKLRIWEIVRSNDNQ